MLILLTRPSKQLVDFMEERAINKLYRISSNKLCILQYLNKDSQMSSQRKNVGFKTFNVWVFQYGVVL